MIESLVAGNASSTDPDDDGQFRLVVNLLSDTRVRVDVFFGSDDRGGRLGEEDRLVAWAGVLSNVIPGIFELLNVFDVVLADAHDVASGYRHRRKEPDLILRN